MNSETLVSAWDGSRLIGLGNAISDGFLVVYYPHLLVLPEYHGHGVGTALMLRLKNRYQNFHQHMLGRRRPGGEIFREARICACRKHRVDVDLRRQRPLIRVASHRFIRRDMVCAMPVREATCGGGHSW
jgi:GNAT superfamily N-acetyltransferase